MQFDVRALSADNLMSQLRIEAADEGEARRIVESRGMLAASIAPVRAGSDNAAAGFGRSTFSLILFSQELLALLNAGLSVVECLEALEEKEANAASAAIIGRLLAGLREGKRFSGVLAEQPAQFPPLFVGIVKAAEGTSDLPHALTRFIDYQQRIDSVRNKVVSATIYPAILMTVGGGVTLFLIGFVVPRFAEVYMDAGRDLPWLSQLLLGWGQFVGAHTAAVAAAAIALALIIAGAVRKLIREGGVGRLLAKLPGFKERVRIYALSRLYLTLGMLLEGGIPIVSALDTVDAVVTADMRAELAQARAAIQAGVPLSHAFEAQQLTTPISLRMLRVGERSGQLGEMLTQSAAFYDGEISRWIDRFTRTFEPLLMAAIGLVVGVIVVLLYMPIFDLAGSLS
ncbi:MAG TPA: type II secretion system F family protein [Burkholderiaceae bacterium]